MNEAESKVFLIQPYFLSPSVLGVLMKSKEDILFLLLGQPHMTFISKLVILFVVMAGILLPQSVVAQTVEGRVTDAITGEVLIGAAVKVVELPGVGGVADMDGEFSINITQSGRYTIETSYIGYEPSVLKEVLVAGAKDVVLDITLRENSSELAEVVVKPRVNKETTVNPTALVGGMML